MRPRHLVPLAALPLLVVTAAPSYAAVTTFSAFGGYQVSSDSAGDTITVSCISSNVSPASAPETPCASITSMSAYPGDGEDTVDLSAVTSSTFPALTAVDIYADTETFPLSVDTLTGSAFDDRIYGDFEDTIDGGPGNDRIEGGDLVHGGTGNDIFWNVSGSTGSFGDAGDDRFVNALSSGGNHGGIGEDTFETDFHQAAAGLDFGLVFTSTQLEVYVGGVLADDPYPVDGFEHLVVTLPEKGAQTFSAAAFPGDLDIRGFGGVDVITGTKESDVLRGGTGNDTLNAQDGVFDVVDCGLGTDLARVDAIDRATGCETIRYAPPQTSAIKGPKNIEKGRSGKFRFSSSVPGSVFQCRIDKKAWKSCSSPYRVSTTRLSVGLHTLRVRAGYPKGNWDATPSKKNFSVVR